VVEEGSPQELLARGGRYAELWARQASLDDVAAPEAAALPDGGAGSDGDDKEQVQWPGLALLHVRLQCGAVRRAVVPTTMQRHLLIAALAARHWVSVQLVKVGGFRSRHRA
jgi:hypothetical protein